MLATKSGGMRTTDFSTVPELAMQMKAVSAETLAMPLHPIRSVATSASTRNFGFQPFSNRDIT